MSQNHLVPLSSSGWSLWKWFQLRSAGFAADGVLALGSDGVHQALESLYSAHKKYSDARDLVKARLDELAELEDIALARTAMNTRDRLLKNAKLRPIGDSEFDARLGAHQNAASSLDDKRKSVDVALELERVRLSHTLRSYAESPLFREALTWQNRAVLGSAVDGYLRSSIGANNAKARERQRLLAKYIQRYTLKNDTIGYFGPTAWGTFDTDCESFTLKPGPVIARRATFFEYWMVATLVEQLDQSPEVLPICSMRLRLGAWVAGRDFTTRDGATTEVSELQAQILTLVNTEQTVGDIVLRVVEQGLAASEAEAYEAVRDVVTKRFATAKIEIPTEVCRPEAWLHDLLVRLPDSEVRGNALATLEALEGHLQEVAANAGDADGLGAAVETLETAFREATGSDAKRGHGKVYAGRQIFYEECVRGGEVTIGSEFIASISEPLELILQSARWFTYQIGKRYRAAFSALYKELMAAEGTSQIPLMTFQIAALKLFKEDPAEPSAIVAKVEGELRRRWESILQINASSSQRLTIRSEDCAARVHELFAAPGPGWPLARYQAPDVMLAAASAEAVARGEFEAVLGELHCGTNTIPMMAPFSLHPDKSEIAIATAADFPEPTISPVLATANRVIAGDIAPNAINLEDKGARSWRSREQVLVSGTLYVEEVGGTLAVVSRVTGERFDIMRVMDYQLSHAAGSHFSLLPRKAHMPRVTIDNLVVSRERWTFKRAEFVDLVTGKKTAAEKFLEVSHWVRERGLPRFVFVVVPNEPKPLYVDFASTVLVDVLLHFLTNATKLSLSEMLPGHSEHWLACDQGERYASELRVVTLDPIAWSPTL